MKYLKTLHEFLGAALNKSKEQQTAFAQKVSNKIYGDNKFNVKYLGEGGQGTSFDIGNKVLKLTKDKNETGNAIKSMKHNFKHIIKYYSVYKIKVPDTVQDQILNKFYVLTMDKIKTFEKGHIIQKLLNSFACPDDSGNINYKLANFGMTQYKGKKTSGEWNFEKFKEINTLEKVCKRKGLNPDEVKGFHEQLIAMMKESMENNILLVDMDYGNVGMQGNTLVVFDMGGMGACPEKKSILKELKIITLEDENLFE